MFRQNPRSPVPPSSFPSGLQPVASTNLAHQQHRISRTDLNFEQALQSQDTVLIREGVDVNSLGADASFPSSSFPTPSPKHPRTPQIGQPGTPTVVPPTPSPTNHGAGPSSSKQLPSSPSITSDSFYSSPDDPDFQTKRRSMYRSPGSASSPDLATLLRKKKRQESPGKPSNAMLAPDRARMRTTSNTPSSASSSSQPPQFLAERFLIPHQPGHESPSPDWVLTSPRGAVENGSPMKLQKTSVRAKTSAFLGKMLGQGTTRERQRQMSESSPNTPMSLGYGNGSKFDVFPPPVPPLPSKVSISSISDVFSSSSSSNNSKLLPLSSVRDSQESDNSMVLVDPFPSSLLSRDYTTDSTLKVKHGKRRSLSASAADIKSQLNSTVQSARPSGEDQNEVTAWASALNGIFTEISDPESLSSLALRDPSSPNKPTYTATPTSNSGTSTHVDRPVFKSTLTAPISYNTPTVNIEPASLVSDSPLSSPLSTATVGPPVRPPRSSSLQTPPNLHYNGQYQNTVRYDPRKKSIWKGSTSAGASPGHAHSPSRDSSHLRVQQRSNASSSEPSLVPHEVDVREQNRNIRIEPYVGFPYSDILSAATSPVTSDISTGDLISARYRSTPSPGREEDVDADSKARALAARCWNEDEEFLSKEKIAEWLGRYGRINNMALGYYMEKFDFSNMRLDVAFRRLCAKLFLKAETQQVDRILEALAARYWACNPTSIMRSASVVHAVVYSLLLLNTDLHVADLATRMSRNQFVRNTLSAIQMQVQPNGSNSDFDTNSIRQGGDYTGNTSRRPKRSDSITSWNSITRDGIAGFGAPLPSATNGTKNGNESTSSIPISNGEPKSPEPVAATLYDRSWEIEMENLLKEMYTAIKHQQVLQPLGSSLVARSSTSSLTPHGPLLRNRSGRGPPDRLTTLKRGSIRGLQTILGAQTGVSPYSSNSSIEGRISPAPSFATSNEAHGSTAAFLTPTLGFASNLSHTIIRETQEDDVHSIASQETASTNISITDEELALLGAPWAKEGMLCRKQFWEANSKKAKVRSWMDVFVVIQKGELNMFTFGDKGGGGSGVVGGGNWLENAQPVGTLILTHALAHALPPPGYNRQRPHCMVLTLGNGGVYFFQAGTEELVNEWVSTCNYWAARQSKEPLAGGVSNMEYGWNRVVDSLSQTTSRTEDDTSQDNDRSDIMSVRSSRSRFGKGIAGSVRTGSSPWADRLFINDWKQPLPPSMPSTHDEETQLESLQKHVHYLNTDLQDHNELRAPMATLYTQKSTNANKALANWENKSKYLLSEIVKYQSYIDSLRNAMALRLKKRGEKALERALVVADPDEFHWTGNPDDETVQDHNESMNGRSEPDSITPTATMSQMHKRELAETGEDIDSD